MPRQSPQPEPARHSKACASERPEQVLNAPVLPRAVNVTALVANAHPPQSSREHPSGEARLVVGSNEPRFATLRNGQAQVPQQRPAAFVRKASKPNRQSTAVVNDAQDGVNLPLRISAPGHVQTPAVVDGQRLGRRTANHLARLSHRVRVLPQHPVHIRLAHGHLAVRKHAIERECDQPTTRVRQVRLEQHQLAQYPGGFAPGAASSPGRLDASGVVDGVRGRQRASPQHPPLKRNAQRQRQGQGRQRNDGQSTPSQFTLHRNHRPPPLIHWQSIMGMRGAVNPGGVSGNVNAQSGSTACRGSAKATSLHKSSTAPTAPACVVYHLVNE